MKVKIIGGLDAFEDRINDFIKNKKVIDIKYQDNSEVISALIMYEEDKINDSITKSSNAKA